MGFPGAGLLVPSCQYTMVPLRGVSTPQVNGLHYANGGNDYFPSATVGYSYAKSYDCNSDEAQQVNLWKLLANLLLVPLIKFWLIFSVGYFYNRFTLQDRSQRKFCQKYQFPS